jgi:hypothetical protein
MKPLKGAVVDLKVEQPAAITTPEGLDIVHEVSPGWKYEPSTITSVPIAPLEVLPSGIKIPLTPS